MAQQIIDEVRRLKQQMRIEASARRLKQPEADRLSRQYIRTARGVAPIRPRYAR